MNTVFLIAADSVRALLHQKLLLGLMLVSLALTVVFSITLSSWRKNVSDSFSGEEIITPGIAGTNKLSAADQRKFREQMDQVSSVTQAGFYGVISFGGSLVALFIFSTAVASEIRRGTIRLTLSKPVTRTEFLLGKYLGGVIVMAAYALLASLSIFIFARSQNVELNEAIKWSPWLMFCRQLMLGSLAMLLSLFIHPLIASALAFFAGNGFYSDSNPLYYLLPSYKDFSVLTQVLQGELVVGKDVLFLTLYAADFVIIMLLLALWRMQRKELV